MKKILFIAAIAALACGCCKKANNGESACCAEKSACCGEKAEGCCAEKAAEAAE